METAPITAQEDVREDASAHQDIKPSVDEEEAMRVSVEAESDYSGSPCSMNFDEELEQVPEEVEADVEEALLARRPSPPPKRGAPQEPEAEVECPICVSLFCEPVVTPCNHRFCMNCLGKVQRLQGHACPICRATGLTPAESLPEDMEMNETLKIIDPEYETRREEATKERAQLKAQAAVPVLRSLRASSPVAHVEVTGAGCPEVNGIFYPSLMSSYYGPTLYQKPNTRLFLFRWEQRNWIIASLSQNDRFSDPGTWYYRAAAHGQSIPVADGWGPMPNGCGVLPAPQLELVMHAGRANPPRASLAEILSGVRASEDTTRTELAVRQSPNQCMRCSIM